MGYWEILNWDVPLSDRSTCWHCGWILISSWWKIQMLLPLLFCRADTGTTCSQLLAEEEIPAPAWWCALGRVQAALHCQPALEVDLLSLSVLGKWCWRRGEQNFTIPRTKSRVLQEGRERTSAFIWNMKKWKKGNQKVTLIRPFASRYTWTVYAICMDGADLLYIQSIPSCSQLCFGSLYFPAHCAQPV